MQAPSHHFCAPCSRTEAVAPWQPRASVPSVWPRSTDLRAQLPVQPAVSAHEPSLFDAYREAGGVLTSDDFIHLLRHNCGQPLSMLARRIVMRELITFSWCGEILIPTFQIDLSTGASRSDVLILLAELTPALYEEEAARWFVRPNQWLADAIPIARMADDFDAVLHAARTDRFVATG